MAIKHKRTNTPGYAWQPADLAEGQIGINLADGTLHVKNTATNQIETIRKVTNTSQLNNDSGFLTSYTETDPVFTASAAAGITSGNISTWNTAVQPGDLATVATSGSYNDLTNKPTIPDSILDLGITDGTVGQILTANGDGTFSFTSVSGVSNSLHSLTDVVITTPTTDQVLRYNGSTWVNATVPAGATNLDGLTDVVITSAITGQGLFFNGTNWVNTAIVDDASTTSTTVGWSANKLNTTLGDISAALTAIQGT